MSVKGWLDPPGDVPRWVILLHRVSTAVGLCAWLFGMWLMLSGALFEREELVEATFAVFGASAAIQLAIRLRTFLRWAVGKDEL